MSQIATTGGLVSRLARKRRSISPPPPRVEAPHGAAWVDEAPMRIGLVAARLHTVHRQNEPRDLSLGLGDLQRGHPLEVLGAENLRVRHGHARIEFDPRLFHRLLRARAAIHGLGDTGERLRLVRLLLKRREGRHHLDHLLDQAAPAPEESEGLVEEDGLIALRHEDGVQRPVKIVAPADPARLHRLDGVQHGARADRDAGGAQGAGEEGDVFRDMARGDVLSHRLTSTR